MRSDAKGKKGRGKQAADEAKPQEEHSFNHKLRRELVSWAWVILAFLFIQGTIVQARVIPSESMENTLLVGDHLLVSRIGYDAQIPFTPYHTSLWRNPQRQQVVVFRAPVPGEQDFIKRVIGVPGDTLEIRDGAVWVNHRILVEPYLMRPLNPEEQFGPITVPPQRYFVMGDNRGNSLDSRYWGFVPRENIIGTPLFIYLSVEAPRDAWQPGHLIERFEAYGAALLHPSRIRLSRFFTTL